MLLYIPRKVSEQFWLWYFWYWLKWRNIIIRNYFTNNKDRHFEIVSFPDSDNFCIYHITCVKGQPERAMFSLIALSGLPVRHAHATIQANLTLGMRLFENGRSLLCENQIIVVIINFSWDIPSFQPIPEPKLVRTPSWECDPLTQYNKRDICRPYSFWDNEQISFQNIKIIKGNTHFSKSCTF